MGRNRYPLAARVILGEIRRHGGLAASYDTLADRFGCHPATIQRSIRRLESAGAICTTRGRPNRYDLP